jgi:hypothetical protein
MDKVNEFNNMDLVLIIFDFANGDTCLFRHPKELMVGPGLDEAKLDKYVGTFVRWNEKTMYQATKHAAWRDIPTSYIYTTTDATLPLSYQKNFVEGVDFMLMDLGGRPIRQRRPKMMRTVSAIVRKLIP